MSHASNPIILGFCGGKGHGKDTAAKVLVEDHGFQRVSFADGLKQTVATALRVPLVYFEDPALKETVHAPSGKTYRHWLQIAGTEWFRSMWEGVWINWWREEIRSRGHDRIVVTDLRFPNELSAIRAYTNNLVFRVTNPRLPPSGDTHASEAHYPSFDVDFDVLNAGSVDDLQSSIVDHVMRFYTLGLPSYRSVHL